MHSFRTVVKRASFYSMSTCSTPTTAPNALSLEQWSNAAINHRDVMLDLLYPPAKTFTRRKHMVHTHPIYNFLHRYYRYSTQDLLAYSPGMGIMMELPPPPSSSSTSTSSSSPYGDHPMLPKKTVDVAPFASSEGDQLPLGATVPEPCLHPMFLSFLSESDVDSLVPYVFYDKALLQASSGRGPSKLTKHKLRQLIQTRDILRSTCKKSPFLGCFGMHEWAMLYSGRKRQGGSLKEENSSEEISGNQTNDGNERHQERLNLRVSQETIDRVVESSGIRCTHFDAWRFFHPDAQPLNIYNPMTRRDQANFEQPGCIHANMDIFRFAYQLYPLVSSELLVEATKLAKKARSIDMRGSPYDVSMYPELQDTLKVETLEGKKKYVAEQEALATEGLLLREKLLISYEDVLGNIDLNDLTAQSHR